MYYHYFGLTEAPFAITVDPRYLFMSPRHRDALAHLLYGVGSGGGFILLTGEVGTGKTTINRCLLEQLPDDTDIAIILNPALNALELLASVCDELGIEYGGDQPTLKTLTDKLHAFLLDNHGRARKTVLLIDEAQHLDFDVLEQIRLLTNLETNSEKLLQIILIGQPELAQMLARPELRQLNQRITARYNLEPLNRDETGAYIHHRLQVAGMSPDRVIFPAPVVRGIHRATRGIPRLINVLCDRVLLGAYGRNKSRADASMLRLAIKEVMGVDTPAPRWPWALAAGLLLAMGAVALYSLLSPVNGQVPVASTVAVPPSSTPAVTSTSPAQPVLAAPVREKRKEEAAPLAVASASQEQALIAPAPPAPAEESPAATLDSALLAPGDGQQLLWQLHGVASAPQPACPRERVEGVACVSGRAETWDELASFDRPIALKLITAERFAAQVLLLGLDGSNAWVRTPTGIDMLQLSALAPYWTGEYSFLWQPPASFTRAIARGDRGPAVAAVASLFAQLDGMDSPLADTTFNEVLERRVRLFQARHGLDDDGVVGMHTLLKLNEQLGIDPSAREARAQLDARASATALNQEGR